jgi:hypothetical protein
MSDGVRAIQLGAIAVILAVIVWELDQIITLLGG